jgi:hypothetical protein
VLEDERAGDPYADMMVIALCQQQASSNLQHQQQPLNIQLLAVVRVWSNNNGGTMMVR